MGTFNKQEFRKIKQRIISVRNPIIGTCGFFVSESNFLVRKYADPLCNESFFRKAIVGTCCPESIRILGNCGHMPLLFDLEKAVIWSALGLKTMAGTINEFLVLREKFDHSFLFGEYEECLRILDESHNRFGYSLWEIRSHIAVLSELDGLEAQRKYADGVRKELQPGSIPAYLVYCASKQCERNVSVPTYLKSTQADYEHFLSTNLPSELCKYAKYMANGYILADEKEINFLDPQTLCYFLFLDDKNALIDRYQSFCKIIDLVFGSGCEELCKIFAPSITNLSTSISDTFLGNVIFQYEQKRCRFHSHGNENVCLAFDLYSVGKYRECAVMVDSLLHENLAYFPLIELYAKCCIHLPETVVDAKKRCTYDSLAFRFKQLFSRKGDVGDIQLNIIKILYTQFDSAWGNHAFYILRKYNHRLVVLETLTEVNYRFSISTPDCIFSFDNKHLSDFLCEIPSSFKESLTVQLSIAVRTGNIEKIQLLPIESIRREKYLAYMLVDSDPNAALRILERNLENITVTAVRQEFDALRIKAYLHLNKLKDAMEVFLPAFQDNSNFIYIGYIDRIFEKIKHGEPSVYGSILTPIICSLYFNYYPLHDDRDDIILNMCYDDYLESCNVSRPSELLSHSLFEHNTPEFIRFLAEVCVPNVMDRSLAFSSYDEVLRERIVICDSLIHVDPDFAAKYKAEIERLTKTLLVRLAKRKVENSKIYIDIEGIRTLLLKEECESYERYLDYRKNNLTEQWVRIINAINNESTDSTFIINLNQDAMLESIAKRTRDIYVADNKYGLDGCLSVRIRHGTLESQLRSCFEKHKLITTKGSDGKYKQNRAWLIGNAETLDKADEVYEVFADFSLKVDNIIAHLKKNLIQIRTEDRNPEGLFDFTVDDNFVSWLGAKLRLDASFDNFRNCILDMLSSVTEHSLKLVREKLQTDVNAAFQQALQDLEKELKIHEKALQFQALRTHIANTRTDISTELNSISEWFKLTQPEGFSDYELALAATISCDIIQYAHSHCVFQCNTDSIDRDISLKGFTFPNVVDIFKILLDNVIKHSGFPDNPCATICGTKVDNTVVLTMENKVLPGSVDATNLKNIETQLNDWERHGHINTEGGSGLHKIKKILTIDMKCSNTIHLACKDNVFSVIVTIDVGGILL